MTREEREAAIAYIKGYRKLDEDLHNTAPKDSISYYATDKCLKYWDMAIQALLQEPTVQDKQAESEKYQKAFDDGYANGYLQARFDYEQEPCDDAVSREAVRQGMLKYGFTAPDMTVHEFVEDELPSVTVRQTDDAERQTGEWIAQDIHNCHTDFRCSECGYIHSFMHLYGEPIADFTYCPNCGADMESEE